MCSCPGFFAVMAVLACIAIAFGSRLQRYLSVGLLLVAIVGFVFQYNAQQYVLELRRRAKELYEQQH